MHMYNAQYDGGSFHNSEKCMYMYTRALLEEGGGQASSLVHVHVHVHVHDETHQARQGKAIQHHHHVHVCTCTCTCINMWCMICPTFSGILKGEENDFT